MQSMDEMENVKQLVEVDMTDPADLVAKIKTAEEKGAVSHRIGQRLQKGQDVLIAGLLYRVEFADFVRGKFTVKMTLKDK